MSFQNNDECSTDKKTAGEKTDSDQFSSVSTKDVWERLNRIENQVADRGRNGDVQNKRPDWVFRQFIDHWRADNKAESSTQPYRSAWKQFSEWMAEQGYSYVSDLSSNFPGRHDDWIVAHDEYNKTKLSRSQHLSRIRTIVQHAMSRGWIHPNRIPDDETWDEVKPDVTNSEKIRSDPLPPEKGERIMKWLRNNKFASRSHIIWLLLFRYGFRVSAIQALDYDDVVLVEPDNWPNERNFNPHLRLKDRPELGPDNDPGLPLKNKREELAGRRVQLQSEHVDIFRHYINNGTNTGAISDRREHQEPDRYGLFGLLTGEHNARLSKRTIRERTHWLTCPTTYSVNDCQCDGCQSFRSENGCQPYPSKVNKHCNNTSSPHQVRHGSITSLLDDNDHSTVAHVVGTSPDTLRNVYDRADEYRRMNRVAGDWLTD